MTRTKKGIIKSSKQPTCKVCSCEDKFDYHIPNEVWKKVVPRRYRNSVVCLACFDDFASTRRIDYSGSLATLYFAGDKAAFTFKTKFAATVQ